VKASSERRPVRRWACSSAESERRKSGGCISHYSGSATHGQDLSCLCTSDYDIGVARLTANGNLDTTFSGDGKQTIAFNQGGYKRDAATAVVIDASGRIVLAGYAERNYWRDYDFGVARLTTNGNLDLTFSGDGKQTIAFNQGGNGEDAASGVALDSLGRIVVVGTAQFNSTGNYDFGVARLTANGALDTAFSGDGKKIVWFDLGGSGLDRARTVALDGVGRIVVAGEVQSGPGDYDFGVARLTANGTLDTTFSGDGKQTIAFNQGGTGDDVASAVAIDSLGRIVVAGTVQRNSTGDYDFGVVRLKANGNLDFSFSGDGKQTIAFNQGGNRSDGVSAVAIDSLGRIVVAGFVTLDNGDKDFGIVRLLGE
jgi:uncharacterized delta-60 repeat protein